MPKIKRGNGNCWHSLRDNKGKVLYPGLKLHPNGNYYLVEKYKMNNQQKHHSQVISNNIIEAKTIWDEWQKQKKQNKKQCKVKGEIYYFTKYIDPSIKKQQEKNTSDYYLAEPIKANTKEEFINLIQALEKEYFDSLEHHDELFNLLKQLHELNINNTISIDLIAKAIASSFTIKDCEK